MDIPLYLKAILLGIVEGLTEFLPISSTGHLIIAGDWLEFNTTSAVSFEIFIQLGAILSVCWLYRTRFRVLFSSAGSDPATRRLIRNLGVSFLPAAVIGYAAHGHIKTHLFAVEVVAWALIVGGVAILLIERLVSSARIHAVETVTPRAALQIGLAQTLSLIPGISRSGATIMGGMLSGLDRRAATEYSFLLAIPVMFAATLYDLARSWDTLEGQEAGIFCIGFITAFISALLAIRFLLHFVTRHSFAVFAWYRIVLGAALLLDPLR